MTRRVEKMDQQSKVRDDAGGLLDDSESDDEQNTVFDFQSQDEKQIGKQLLMLFRWISLGIFYAIPGPNLLAFTCSTGTRLANIGLLFTARGTGSLLGSIATRKIINKSRSSGILLFGIFSMAVLISILPNIKNIAGAAGMMFPIGLMYGMTTEGYNIIEISSGLQKVGKLNKKAIALSMGAAIAPLISLPYLKNTIIMRRSNGTAPDILNASTASTRDVDQNTKGYIFPNVVCGGGSQFAKSLYVSTIPLYVMLLIQCYMLWEKSQNLDTGQLNSQTTNRIADWRVYGLRFILFVVMFFYQGSYVLAAVVIFSYISLGKYDVGQTKACLFVMMLWIAFAFGYMLQHIILFKITRVERRLGVAFFKACVCFLSSILLMKIDSTNGMTLSLFMYMFFVAEIGTLVQDVLTKRAVVSEDLANRMRLLADALAESIFPVATLGLMYNKGWNALSFVILVISVMQFLACTLLVLCPAELSKDLGSLNYENISNAQEVGGGKKIRNEIRKLLGGYTDQEVGYVTSDEEVVFVTKSRKKT